MDFVIAKGSEIIPIEVKSGKDYLRHSALSNIMTSKEYNIQKGLVFCNGNLRRDGKILYLPVYMIMLLEPDNTTPGIYKIDLQGLE